MRALGLLRLGLGTALVAWSGLLLAEGPRRVADDVGVATPRRHAPRRKVAPKKKGRRKPARAADAGTGAVVPSAVDASASTSPDAAEPAHARTPHAAVDDEEEDDDEDEDEDDHTASAGAADGGAPRRARKRTRDAGGDAGPEDDDDEEDEDDDEDTKYELGVELAAESRLVWRGLAESRGAVLQSSGWAGLYGFSVEGWASYLLNSEGPFDPMTVVGADVTASYALSLGDVRIAPGATLLYFPEGLSSSTTAEASLGLSYRIGDFRVVSGTNIDVSRAPGAYFGTLGLSWGRARPPWSVKGIVDLGWATEKYNYEYLARSVAGVDVLHTGVAARYDVGSVVYVELHADVSALVAPALSGSVQEPMLITGGAAVGLDWSVGR